MSSTFETCGRYSLMLLALAGGALAQTQSDADRAAKQALDALHHREMPEATIPCTADEAKWWAELRTAGAAVRETMGEEKETKKFLGLLKQGREKSYEPPVANRGALILYQVPFRSTEESRKKNISGALALVVELRPDATVGEVKIVQGLGYGLDENAIKAARQIIFLPAVKDRKFVTFYMPMTMSLSALRPYP